MPYRMNATVFPSGEILGWISPTDPSSGEVSFRFSPSSRANRKMASGSLGEFGFDTANHSPSGDQAGAPRRLRGALEKEMVRSVILRSVPPSDGIRYSPLSSFVERIKAM